MVIGGRLVYRVDHELTPDSYYPADRSAIWYFERDVRAAPDNFFTVDAQVRGPEAERLWLRVEALVASLELADE